MAERQSVSERTQIGVEVTPGTLVTATKVLNSISISPTPEVTVRRFRPRGKKWNTIAAPGREQVAASIEGAPSYTEMQYIHACALRYQAPTQIMDSATPTGAYEYLSAPQASAEDTVKTLTVEAGSAFRAHRFGYGMIPEFEFSWDQDEVNLSGTMFGRALEDGITMSSGGGVTELPQEPILPTQLDVFLDNAHAGLGTTKLLRVLSGSIGVSGRFGPVRVTNSALPSFATHVEREATGEITLLVEADTVGMAFLTQLRAGQTKFMRIQGQGPRIYDGTVDQFHMLQYDAAVKVVDVGEFSDEEGVYAIEYTFDIQYDPTWGNSILARVVNNVVSL